MSRRRNTQRRPVEDRATDLVDYEKFDEHLQVALAVAWPDSRDFDTVRTFTSLLAGTCAPAVDDVLNAIPVFGPQCGTTLAWGDTVKLIQMLEKAQRHIRKSRTPLTPADLDRLLRHADWLPGPTVADLHNDIVTLVRCPVSAHGWTLRPPASLNVDIPWCAHCPCPLPRNNTGRRAKYCTPYCRLAAHRGKASVQPAEIRLPGRSAKPYTRKPPPPALMERLNL